MTKQKNMRARVGMRARAGTTTMTMMRMMNPSCSERDMQPIEYSASSASMHYIWGPFKLGKKSTLRQEKHIYCYIYHSGSSTGLYRAASRYARPIHR